MLSNYLTITSIIIIIILSYSLPTFCGDCSTQLSQWGASPLWGPRFDDVITDANNQSGCECSCWCRREQFWRARPERNKQWNSFNSACLTECINGIADSCACMLSVCLRACVCVCLYVSVDVLRHGRKEELNLINFWRIFENTNYSFCYGEHKRRFKPSPGVPSLSWLSFDITEVFLLSAWHDRKRERWIEWPSFAAPSKCRVPLTMLQWGYINH